MTDSLTVLTERRAQIAVQINDNFSKNLADIKARFPNKSHTEQLKMTFAPDNEFHKLETKLKKELADLDSEIECIEKERLQAEKELQKKESVKTQWTDAESKLKRKKYVDKIIDSLKVQIMPSLECVEPNDKVVKDLFLFGSKSYQKALTGTNYRVKEKKTTKKRDAVFSTIAIQNAEGYEDDSPLDEFDRAVLGVIISEYLAGNRYTTVNIIFRALIGKIGKACKGIIPHKNQQDAIAHSVMKLMGTVVDFSSVTESLQEMKYTDKDGNEVILKADNLLSASLLDAKINGQVMEGIIFFKDNSPLFDIADAKCQVIRYPHELLNVPNQNNTPRIISIKKYVMRRICEIKLHKQLTHTITFDDVFTHCRMTNSPREVKRDARNAIIKLFEHLQAQKFISSFEPVQQRGKFLSVKFSF